MTTLILYIIIIIIIRIILNTINQNPKQQTEQRKRLYSYNTNNDNNKRIDGLKLIIALAAKYQWYNYQLDIKAAYLNAPLDYEIYTTIPPGDPNYGKGFWRLNKALYGLKQSGRQWNHMITKFLISIGYSQLSTEQCIFKKSNNGNILKCIIGLYVDDMIITGDINEINNIIREIKNKFKISKCGVIDNILGINVQRNDRGHYYIISQQNYIKNMLCKYNINNIKPTKTPCTGYNTKYENKTKFDKTIYKSAIGIPYISI
eukprot:jgi/Orpsp1_1/1177639/evm.model.c7180000062253.1